MDSRKGINLLNIFVTFDSQYGIPISKMTISNNNLYRLHWFVGFFDT